MHTEQKAIQLAMETLDKIRDPRKRHKEPDKYTECACIMNMADEAFWKLQQMGFNLAPKVQDKNTSEA